MLPNRNKPDPHPSLSDAEQPRRDCQVIRLDAPDTGIGEMPLFFLHVPKTAGTSVRHFLEAPLRRHEIVRTDGGEEEYRKKRAKSFGSEVKLVSGHLPFWFAEALPGPRQTLVFLRNPVDRVLSTYFFWKSLPQPSEGDQSAQANLLRQMAEFDLERFVLDPASPGGGSISNFACRLIGHRTPWQTDNPFDAEVLSLACARLEQIDMLGLSERMRESLELIARRLRIPFTGALPRQNVTAGRQEKREIPKSILRAIADANEGDMLLWERANAELDRRLKAAPRAPLKLAKRHRSVPVLRDGQLKLLLGEDPILGCGWFEQERAKGASWRFVSAKEPASLNVRLATDDEVMLAIDSPFAVAGFNYAGLDIRVDGKPIKHVVFEFPDRNLIFTEAVKLRSPEHEITLLANGPPTGVRPESDGRDISFAVRSIAWLPCSATTAWQSFQLMAAEQSKLLEATRADKANISAHIEALLASNKSKALQIEALQAEAARHKELARQNRAQRQP